MASLRRNIEQIVHCAEEALSVCVAATVVGHQEELNDAVEDLKQARQLIDEVLPQLRRIAELQKRKPLS